MAPAQPGTTLAKRGEAPLAVPQDLLAAFGDAASEGMENVSSNEIILPRLGIIQPTSPMATDGTARPGDICNVLTGENFGQRVKIYPLMFWASRIKWAGSDLNAKIECSAKDGRNGTVKTEAFGMGVCANCPHSQWQDGEGPLCTEFKNILLIPVHPLESGDDLFEALQNAVPAAFSAKRTAIKATNQFLSAAAALRLNGKRPPLFASSWALATEKKQNDQGTYFLPVFTRLDYVESLEVFEYLRSVYSDAKLAQDRYTIDQSDYATEGHRTEEVDEEPEF